LYELLCKIYHIHIQLFFEKKAAAVVHRTAGFDKSPAALLDNNGNAE
jgi:hypothetical protein